MKLVFAIIAILFLFPITTWAEGPPISAEGELEADYLAFALTKDQKESLNHRRAIELTTRQKLLLKDFLVEDVLLIITEHYYDCTCGMTYGVWYHPDSIAVFKYLQSYKRYETEAIKSMRAENDMKKLKSYIVMRKRQMKASENTWLDWFKDGEASFQNIFMSPQGDFYIKGRYVSRDSLMERLDDLLEEQKKGNEDPDDLVIYLNLPPIFKNPNKADILEQHFIFQKRVERYGIPVRIATL